VWDILKAWSQDKAHTLTFLNVIRVGRMPLSECIEVIWPSSMNFLTGSTASSLVFNLMKSWGIDLSKGSEERSARNISSYNPHHLNPTSCDVPCLIEFLVHIWDMFQPGISNGYDQLDRHILKKSLRTYLEAINNDEQFVTEQISSKFENLDESVKALTGKDFLTGEDRTPSPNIMRFAEEYPSDDVLGMVSRAGLLLRTATAYTCAGFREAGLLHPEHDLEQWLEKTGVERGYWSTGQSPSSMVDLWKDIENALHDLENVRSSLPNERFKLFNNLSTSSRKLAESERAFLWGIAA